MSAGFNGNSLAVTVDIEDWYHIPSVTGSPFSQFRDASEFYQQWSGRYDYLTDSVRKVLGILGTCNVTATFFVVADIVRHYPGLIECICEQGHEIAVHGLSHACKIDPQTKSPLMSTAEFEARTKDAKHLLETTVGERIYGYRAPNALVSGWMVDSLEKLGFLYDASVSVNSLYNKTDSQLIGVSSCPYTPRPHSLDRGDERDIVEFPFAYWDVGGVKIPASGGPMLRFLGSRMILEGLRQSLKRGHTVFYFHPLDISPEKFPRVGRGRPFYWAIKGDLVERRLLQILRGINGVKKMPLSELCGEAL